MADLFAVNPLLLLFVVAALGYFIGHVRMFGTKLGVAAVLFVGLAFGAWDARLQLPELLQSFGLVLFVYTIGVSCGPGFMATLRGKGWRQGLLIIGVLSLATALAALLARLCGFSPAATAGLLAGALTNTPALAAVTELAKGQVAMGLPPGSESAATVAYSIAYPVGVLGVIGAFAAYNRIVGGSENSTGATAAQLTSGLVTWTLEVNQPEATTQSLNETLAGQHLDVIAGRRWTQGKLTVAHPGAVLAVGDLLTLVGCETELMRAVATFGPRSHVDLAEDRGCLDFRRILVSDPALAGRRLRDLGLMRRFGGIATRVRRGDEDMLAAPGLKLELGDRLRVVAPHAHLDQISHYLGNSERKISEVDITTLGLGIAMGLGFGLVAVPIPGGISLRLGLAGGVMLVALTIGALARTGPILWSLPHSANLILRQLGLVLFLAAVGTRAGGPFVATLGSGGLGWRLFFAGALITGASAGVALWLGHAWLKLPRALLFGMVGGLQTQPALLACAEEEAGGEEAGMGYAEAFPLAFIGKVILAQVLFVCLS